MTGPQTDEPSEKQRTDRETSGADWWLMVMVGLAVVAASGLVVVAAVVLFR